jgi:hypothetical protein
MIVVPVGPRVTIMSVAMNAPPVPKLIILALIISSVAAAIVCVGKLASGPRISGGSAFLSGLRFGGPLAGLFGAALTGLNLAVGAANLPQAAPEGLLAHGYAEIMMLMVFGFFTGAVAVIANWAVESRIDRSVLRA